MKKDSNITIFLLIVVTLIIIFTSYGWFIQNEEVSVSLEGNIDTWDIKFEYGTEEIESNEYTIELGDIYPGITLEKKIVITNEGSIPAVLECNLKKITIFGTEYDLNNVPFEISSTFENEGSLNANGGTNTCTITFKWIYEETGAQYTIDGKTYTKDEFDTYLADNATSSTDDVKITVELTAQSS